METNLTSTFPYSPYEDTFNVNNHIHKVLFKVGTSFTHYHLNLLQSILQEQIAIFGRHFFKNGSFISAGHYKIVPNALVFDIQDAVFEKDSTHSIENLKDLEFIEEVSGKSVISLFSEKITTFKNSRDKLVLSASSDSTIFSLSSSTSVKKKKIYKLWLSNKTSLSKTEYLNMTLSSATSYLVFDPGIIFLNGYFLNFPKQYTVIPDPNCSIGFELQHSIISASEDISLLDNAEGAPSEGSEGADRLKIFPKLTSYPLIEDTNFYDILQKENFIEYLRLKNSILIKDVTRPIYDEFEKTLERRTFDEAGNYTVNPFLISITNKDINNFQIEISPGKAYIFGSEFDSIAKRTLDLPKSTERFIKDNQVSVFPSFSFIKVVSIDYFIDPVRTEVLVFYTSDDVKMGYGRCFYVNRVSYSQYHLVMIDISFIPGYKSEDVAYVSNLDTHRIASVQEFVLVSKNQPDTFLVKPSSVSAIDSYSNITCIYEQIYSAVLNNTISIKPGETFPDNILCYHGFSSDKLPVQISAISVNPSSSTVILESSTPLYYVMIEDIKGIIQPVSSSIVVEKNIVVPFTSSISIASKLKSVKEILFNQKNIVADFNVVVDSNDTLQKGFILNYIGSNESSLTNNSITIIYDAYDQFQGQVLLEKDSMDFRKNYFFNIPSIKPESEISYSYAKALDRFDKLVLTSNKTFELIHGTSALAPIPPKERADAMTLYTLFVPSGISSPSSIGIKFLENKRYTMRDIGNLDTRIGNLEFYTALNLLEKKTSDQSFPDTSGNDRFKNGIMVDNFKTYKSVSLDSKDAHFSLDTTKGLLRPSFVLKNQGSHYNSKDSTTKDTGDLITLPYSETPFITQTDASDVLAINSFEVFVYEGKMTLSPQTDCWVDTEIAPTVNINQFGETDVYAELGAKGFNSQWGSWEKDILTVPETESKNSTSNVSFADIDAKIEKRLWNPSVDPNVDKATLEAYGLWTGSGYTRGFSQTKPDGFVNGQAAILLNFKGTKVVATNDSTTFQKSQILTNPLSNNVSDISISPYQRALSVRFDVTCLKPNTKFFALFDDIDVTKLCYIFGSTHIDIIALPTPTPTLLSSTNISIIPGVTPSVSFVTPSSDLLYFTYYDQNKSPSEVYTTGKLPESIKIESINKITPGNINIYFKTTMAYQEGRKFCYSLDGGKTWSTNPKLDVSKNDYKFENWWTSLDGLTKILFVGSLKVGDRLDVIISYVETTNDFIEYGQDVPSTKTPTNWKTGVRSFICVDGLSTTSLTPIVTPTPVVNSTSITLPGPLVQEDLYTNEFGELHGICELPAKKFKTGAHTFKLVDTLSVNTSMISSYAVAQFFSNGLNQTKTQTLISTREPVTTSQEHIFTTIQDAFDTSVLMKTFKVTLTLQGLGDLEVLDEAGKVVLLGKNNDTVSKLINDQTFLKFNLKETAQTLTSYTGLPYFDKTIDVNGIRSYTCVFAIKEDIGVRLSFDEPAGTRVKVKIQYPGEGFFLRPFPYYKIKFTTLKYGIIETTLQGKDTSPAIFSTPTPTNTPNISPTPSTSFSITPTQTPSITPTQTPTSTQTPTPGSSPTPTPTQTSTSSPSPTPCSTPISTPGATPYPISTPGSSSIPKYSNDTDPIYFLNYQKLIKVFDPLIGDVVKPINEVYPGYLLIYFKVDNNIIGTFNKICFSIDGGKTWTTNRTIDSRSEISNAILGPVSALCTSESSGLSELLVFNLKVGDRIDVILSYVQLKDFGEYGGDVLSTKTPPNWKTEVRSFIVVDRLSTPLVTPSATTFPQSTPSSSLKTAPSDNFLPTFISYNNSLDYKEDKIFPTFSKTVNIQQYLSLTLTFFTRSKDFSKLLITLDDTVWWGLGSNIRYPSISALPITVVLTNFITESNIRFYMNNIFPGVIKLRLGLMSEQDFISGTYVAPSTKTPLIYSSLLTFNVIDLNAPTTPITPTPTTTPTTTPTQTITPSIGSSPTPTPTKTPTPTTTPTSTPTQTPTSTSTITPTPSIDPNLCKVTFYVDNLVSTQHPSYCLHIPLDNQLLSDPIASTYYHNPLTLWFTKGSNRSFFIVKETAPGYLNGYERDEIDLYINNVKQIIPRWTGNEEDKNIIINYWVTSDIVISLTLKNNPSPILPSPTPTPTPTPTISLSPTPTPSQTVTPTLTPTPTSTLPTPTPTPTLGSSPTPTPILSPTPTPSLGSSPTPTPYLSNTPTPTPLVFGNLSFDHTIISDKTIETKELEIVAGDVIECTYFSNGSSVVNVPAEESSIPGLTWDKESTSTITFLRVTDDTLLRVGQSGLTLYLNPLDNKNVILHFFLSLGTISANIRWIVFSDESCTSISYAGNISVPCNAQWQTIDTPLKYIPGKKECGYIKLIPLDEETHISIILEAGIRYGMVGVKDGVGRDLFIFPNATFSIINEIYSGKDIDYQNPAIKGISLETALANGKAEVLPFIPEGADNESPNNRHFYFTLTKRIDLPPPTPTPTITPTSSTTPSPTPTRTSRPQATPTPSMIIRKATDVETKGVLLDNGSVAFHDPLAESFFIDPTLNPEGVFLASIDLFFWKKDYVVPVSLEIRQSVNSYPSSKEIVPFSIVVVQAKDVQISEDASLATNFKFPSPVFLLPGEYDFVVITDSVNYQVWIGTLGNFKVGTTQERITKNPYSGVLFRSSNNTAWIPQEDSDFTFRINRCKFLLPSSVAVIDNDLFISNSETSKDSSFPFTSIRNNAVTILPDGTSFSSSKVDLKDLSNGTKTITLGLNETQELDSVFQLKDSNFIDPKFNKDTTPSISNKITFTSTKDTVSPVIDKQRLSSVLIYNIINTLGNDIEKASEKKAYGGTATAKYITKEMKLALDVPANTIHVSFAGSLPKGTQVRTFFRVFNSVQDSADFTILDKNWQELGLASKTSNSRETFIDFSAESPLPLVYQEGNSTTITNFDSVMVKLVMESDNPASVPLIKDFRVIALSS